MATAFTVSRLDIGNDASIDSIERELEAKLNKVSPGGASLRIVQDVGSSFFADLWASLLIGTAARSSGQLDVVLWGLDFDAVQTSVFWSSPAGFATMQMADRVYGEIDQRPVNMELFRRRLTQVGGGIGDFLLERSRTIVEFDHDSSVAPILAPPPGLPGGGRSVRRTLIDRAVLEFRRKLELGALRRRATVQAEGVAGAVGAFIFELFDNADLYGRPLLYEYGVRMLRMRKHVANNRDELLTRAGDVPGLGDYLSRVFVSRSGAVALIEASISDFGPGIVDGFLASPAGYPYKKTERDRLFDKLLHDRFGSRPADPASGLGISNALEALSSMSGYASVRTGEFFARVSCASSDPEPRMIIERRNVSISGTHWQLLWPMAL